MPYTPTEALRHLRNLATKAVPNCVNLDAIDRVVVQTTFTEASTEEALLILDNARDASLYPDDHSLMMAIDMAIQKLRPEPAPVHDAAALEQLKDDTTDCPYCGGSGEADPDTSDVNCDVCDGSGRVAALPDPNAALEQLAQQHPIELPWMQAGNTVPACNRCQYIARSVDVVSCPYCGGNWTHDVTRPLVQKGEQEA